MKIANTSPPKDILVHTQHEDKKVIKYSKLSFFKKKMYMKMKIFSEMHKLL